MKATLKWIGIALVSILVVLVVLGGILFVLGGQKLAATVQLVDVVPDAAVDTAAVEWGEHLVRIHACQECHGDDLGGRVLDDAPPFKLVASNLTTGAGGIGDSYTRTDWERAIRHGVKPDGRGLVVMPSDQYMYLSDDDLGAMIAYLETVPAVDNELPETEIKPLGRMLAATGAILLMSDLVDHHATHLERAPTRGATAEYGAYRASTVCTVCHGQRLGGGQHPEPGGPPAPSLAPYKKWGRDGLAQSLRTGVSPTGYELDAHYMPWTFFRHMTDEEIDALYAYISSIDFTQDALAERE